VPSPRHLGKGPLEHVPLCEADLVLKHCLLGKPMMYSCSCSKYHKSCHPGQLYHSLSGPNMWSHVSLLHISWASVPLAFSVTSRIILPRPRHCVHHVLCSPTGADVLRLTAEMGILGPQPWCALGLPACYLHLLPKRKAGQVSCHGYIIACGMSAFRCRLAKGREVVDSYGVAGANASVLKPPILPSAGVLLSTSDILQ